MCMHFSKNTFPSIMYLKPVTPSVILLTSKGVVRAKVGLLTEVAEIFYDGGVTDAERLKDFVETVGYEANITPR